MSRSNMWFLYKTQLSLLQIVSLWKPSCKIGLPIWTLSCANHILSEKVFKRLNWFEMDIWHLLTVLLDIYFMQISLLRICCILVSIFLPQYTFIITFSGKCKNKNIFLWIFKQILSTYSLVIFCVFTFLLLPFSYTDGLQIFYF